MRAVGLVTAAFVDTAPSAKQEVVEDMRAPTKRKGPAHAAIMAGDTVAL